MYGWPTLWGSGGQLVGVVALWSSCFALSRGCGVPAWCQLWSRTTELRIGQCSCSRGSLQM